MDIRLSNSAGGSHSTKQYGLFATKSYAEGDEIFEESPLIKLSEGDIRSQFKSPSFLQQSTATTSSILTDIILPQSILKKLDNDSQRTSKLRGMLVALASYAIQHKTMNEEIKSKLLELYHPEFSTEEQNEKDAIELAKLAIKCSREIAASNSSLDSLLSNQDESLLKVLLIYSCNSFENGRIYHRLSRVNHSCNPNAVVVEDPSGENDDVSILKAACDIKAGDEIHISYLGKYLFSSYPIRQRLLKANKHFVCQCVRCKDDNNTGDLASRIPCPSCHPRTGRYLDEDVMFDDGDDPDEYGLKVSYATPKNGMMAEDRSAYCPSCKNTTAVVADDCSMKKKKEAMAITYMCKAEEKVFDHLNNGGSSNEKKQRSDDGIDTEREVDQQFYQMATSICGQQHWTTHFLNLSLIEESLASFHSILMDPAAVRDEETMEEMFVDIAECADGIGKAYKYAASLQLNINPAHWLFDYTLGLARTLVGLGDSKSQKYSSTWIAKVEKYAEKFETNAMNKVVVALRDVWKREEGGKGKGREVEEQKDDLSKRRKLG